MTMEETSPRAPGLSPFSVCSSVNPGDTSAAATSPPLTAGLGLLQRFQHRNVLKVNHSVIARRLNLRNQKVKACSGGMTGPVQADYHKHSFSHSPIIELECQLFRSYKSVMVAPK